MILEIKKKLKDKEISTLITNFFSLVIIQALNVLLPFLTIPYLIGRIGLENFGLLTFVHSFILFLVIFVEYGFNISTTREISIHSNEKEAVSRIYSEVLRKVIITKFRNYIVRFRRAVIVCKSGTKYQIQCNKSFCRRLYIKNYNC